MIIMMMMIPLVILDKYTYRLFAHLPRKQVDKHILVARARSLCLAPPSQVGNVLTWRRRALIDALLWALLWAQRVIWALRKDGGYRAASKVPVALRLYLLQMELNVKA